MQTSAERLAEHRLTVVC